MKNCKNCTRELVRKLKESLRDFEARRFCDRVCSGYFNGKAKIQKTGLEIQRVCPECLSTFSVVRKANNNVFTKHTYCNECARVRRLISRGNNPERIENRTKGDLFIASKNWQSARGAIRKHAELVCKQNKVRYRCKICEYAIHVEICHIIAVKDFPDTATLKEINSIDNLVMLCPNHHWEFDNGLFTLMTGTGVESIS
jgi:uncharacterized protein YbaR (Trm112 family)